MGKARAARIALLDAESANVQGALRMPLYHQIYLILRQKVIDGVYPFGARLPSEQDLVEAYDVSRITAKRALDELAAEGMVIRERGRGTWVKFRVPVEPLKASVEGMLENLLAMGLETEVRVLSFDYVPASDDVARELECAEGEIVQRSVRNRLLEGRPFSHLVTYVPEDIGRQFSAEDLSEKPLLGLLERTGVVVEAVTQMLSATLADAEIAAQLKIDVGAALLKLVRLVRDQTGRPVEYITALYRPELYQYRMVLSRVSGDSENMWAASEPGNASARSASAHAILGEKL